MDNEHRMSRRASLKGLGTLGAAVVLGEVAAAQNPADPKPAAPAQGKTSASVVDVAVDRFTKGHA